MSFLRTWINFEGYYLPTTHCCSSRRHFGGKSRGSSGSKWLVGGDDVAPYALPDPISCVSNQENRELIKTVSGEKIRRMLYSMAEDKASRPDGFSPLFFRRY